MDGQMRTDSLMDRCILIAITEQCTVDREQRGWLLPVHCSACATDRLQVRWAVVIGVCALSFLIRSNSAQFNATFLMSCLPTITYVRSYYGLRTSESRLKRDACCTQDTRWYRRLITGNRCDIKVRKNISSLYCHVE